MFIIRVCTVAILICASMMKEGHQETCNNIGIEITTVQTSRCMESTFRLGVATVLINKNCNGFYAFQNGKVPRNVSFEIENNFFDAQQTLASNILFGIEPEPMNVTLRYIIDISHKRYVFLLYINDTLTSIYDEMTVLYCDLRILSPKVIGEYVKGRGIEILKSKMNELQDKWKIICKFLEVRTNRVTDINSTKCFSYVTATTPIYADTSTYTDSSTHIDLVTVWPVGENIFGNVCTCELISVIGIVTVISVTTIVVIILIVTKNRLRFIANRYHKELSKYWL